MVLEKRKFSPGYRMWQTFCAGNTSIPTALFATRQNYLYLYYKTFFCHIKIEKTHVRNIMISYKTFTPNKKPKKILKSVFAFLFVKNKVKCYVV